MFCSSRKAVVEEERSRRLGELGSGWWGTSEDHAGEETCGGFFTKKRRSTSQELGTTLPGEVAFAPTHVRLRAHAITRYSCVTGVYDTLTRIVPKQEHVNFCRGAISSFFAKNTARKLFPRFMFSISLVKCTPLRPATLPAARPSVLALLASCRHECCNLKRFATHK